ncbi:MAG: O-antigen ligase family protein [Myxococcota bacterium]
MKYFFLVIPFVLTAIFYGGVHPLYQITTATVAAFFPGFLLWNRRPMLNALFFWSIMTVSIVMFMTLIPVPIRIHQYVFPHVHLLDQSFSLLGIEWYPLTPQPFEQLTAVAVALLALLVCAASAQILKSSTQMGPFSKILLLSVGAFIVLGIIQRLTDAQSIFWISGIPIFSKREFFGTWIYPNHAAVVMAMTLPLVCAQQRATWRWSLLLLWLAGLTMAQSRGGWLAAYMGLMVYGLFAWPRRTAILLPAVLLLNGIALAVFGGQWLTTLSDWVRYTPNPVVDSGRGEIWIQSLPLLNAAPIIGAGYGSIEDLFETVRTTTHYTRTSHIHSEPIEILISNGLIVGTGILILWGKTLHFAYKKLKSLESKSTYYIHWLAACWSGLIALSVHSLIDLSFRSTAVVLLAALLLGPCCRSRKALPRYFSNVVAMALLFASGFGIYMHNAPESRYSYSEHWLSQGEANGGQFAVKAYRNSAMSRPLYARAYRQLALSTHQSNPIQATKFLEHASQLAPKQFVNWMALAEVYTEQKACPAAWSAWKKTSDLRMETIDTFRKRIPGMFSCGSVEEAAQVIRPNIPRQKAEVALWLGQNGHWSIAKSMMDEALMSDQQLILFSAEFYLKAKDFQKAWSLAQQSTVQNCQSMLTKAKVLTMLYHPSEAEHYYLKARDHCGNKLSIQNGLTTVKLQQGDNNLLEKALIQIKKKPRMHGLRRNIMNAISLTEDHAALIPHYEQLFEFKQLTSDEQFDLIQLYSGQKSTIWPKSTPLR